MTPNAIPMQRILLIVALYCVHVFERTLLSGYPGGVLTVLTLAELYLFHKFIEEILEIRILTGKLYKDMENKKRP